MRMLRECQGLTAAAVAVTLTTGSIVALRGQSTPSTPKKARVSRSIQVDKRDVWTITDIDIAPGEKVMFSANGNASCAGVGSSFGPEGIPRGFRDLLRILPLPQAGRGALIGRVGEPGVAQPFVVGSSLERISPTGGVLSLGVNRADSDVCDPKFSVRIDVFEPSGGAPVVVARPVDAIENIDAALMNRLPRRIGDKAGNPGDMVNFLVLGSEAGMKQVFTAAGWVTVDPDVKNAILSGVLGSLSKESYLTLPMSELYLFGRPQDYGWAHAEPIKVAASRHHLRVWRAPFEVGTSTLWVGAATHDIGFERDRRNNGITHKIDPNIDFERQFVEQTLVSTGLVSQFTYVLPDKPLLEAKTATGGSFHSDGRLLVLKLNETAAP